MLSIHSLGHTFRTIYEQTQPPAPPPTPTEPEIPRLAGGLWSAFKFEEAAAKYKQHLHQHYGFLHILGHNRPVPLEGVFTDVYLYDRPLALRRLAVEELEEQFRQRQSEQKGAKRVDGLSLVRTESHLFILGQPGAGKTTFLKHVALEAAKGDLPSVPIFISLKALADSQKPILDFMAQEMQICGFPEPTPFLRVMLQSGQMLILLDGLDEVTPAQETSLSLVQNIENLIRQYAANRFLITCRTAVTDYQFPGFTTVEMSNFSPEQVDAFIHKWFQHEPSLGNNCLQELNLPEHEGLRDLASTPLLLNLLCLTYEEVGHFPQRRIELYEEALNALLIKWDSSRRIHRAETYRQLSLGRKRQLLAFIAATTFSQGKYLLPQAEIIRHILDYLKMIPETGALDETDGEAILRAIEAQHGIIVERARGVYGFAHLTFQEYFTAKYVAEAGERATLLSHCADYQWREVFLLTASLLGQADDFFARFIIRLDQFVNHHPQLLSLLTWAYAKGNQVGETPFTQLLLRCLYLSLDRDHFYAGSFIRSYAILSAHPSLIDDHQGRDKITRAFAGIRDRDLARALAFNHSYDKGLSPNHKRDSDFVALWNSRDLARTIIVNINNGKDLAHTPSPDLALDFALVYTRLYGRWDPGLVQPFIELALRLSRDLGLFSLLLALEQMSIPARDALEAECQQFSEAIWQVAQKERQLQTFELNEDEGKILSAYLEGAILFVECLNLATVIDRDAILSRLLVLPPEQNL
jgi:hypothetical protein